MFNKFMIAICVLGLGVSANAKPAQKASEGSLYDTDKVPKVEDSSIPEAMPSDLPTPNESWYSLWGLGFSENSYSGDVGDIYEAQSNASGADKSLSLSMDLLGFYWPLAGHKTMMGVVLNGSSDSFTYANGNTSRIVTRLLGFSTHHFYGKNIGDGWFVRGDVGLTSATAVYTIGATEFSYTTEHKLGYMFGGGYGFALGQETRLLVGLYVRPIPDLKFNSGENIKGTVTNLTAGFLF